MMLRYLLLFVGVGFATIIATVGLSVGVEMWSDIPVVFSNGFLLVLCFSVSIIISTMKNLNLSIKGLYPINVAFVLSMLTLFILICRFFLCLVSDIFYINLRVIVLVGLLLSLIYALILITTPEDTLKPIFRYFNYILVRITVYLIFNCETLLSAFFALSLYHDPKMFVWQLRLFSIFIVLVTWLAPLLGLLLAIALLLYMIVLKYPSWNNYTTPLTLADSCLYYENIMHEKNTNNLSLAMWYMIAERSPILKYPNGDELDTFNPRGKGRWLPYAIKSMPSHFENAAVRFDALSLKNKVYYSIFAGSVVAASLGSLYVGKQTKDVIVIRTKSNETIRLAEAKSNETIRLAEAKSNETIRLVEAKCNENIRLSEEKVRLSEDKVRLAKIALENRKLDYLNQTRDSDKISTKNLTDFPTDE